MNRRFLAPKGRSGDGLEMNVKHWLVTFTSGDVVWSHRLTGTYREAHDYAESLCYQVSTRFRISELPHA